MAISTFEIKSCGQKLCAQKDSFCKPGYIYDLWKYNRLLEPLQRVWKRNEMKQNEMEQIK